MTPQQIEEDFPKGHPARADFNPSSPEAQEWMRQHVHPLGERDFPVDHPAAVDTAGNVNHVSWAPGVDPFNPHREPHTGRTPEQAAAVAQMSKLASLKAEESPIAQPLDATVVNAALDAKRHDVGRDLLTPAEYAEVVGKIQSENRSPVDMEAARAKVELQHKALTYLLSRGYITNTAMEIIAREGAEKILEAAAQAPAGA